MGVGPLIHAPFLLEHSFWGILDSSSDMSAGRRIFVSSVVGGWDWEFFENCAFGLRVRSQLARYKLK